MNTESVVISMARSQGRKAMLLVMDGLGGFRTAERASELTEARTPNLDRLAREGSLGLHDQARSLLAGRDRGNYELMRGFDTHKELPSFPDCYKLRALAIDTYPMY